MSQARDTIEVEIERILPGGVGLAHAEGLTVFVYLAAPCDVVRVTIERTRGKVAFASIKEIIKPSPLRVEPPCPYFGRCGGCDFQQLGYETQLQTKVEIIRDCLHRLGGFDPAPEIEIHPSPNEWHYRARANWQVDQVSRQLGYFERGSNRVCDVEFCAVLTPELQKSLEGVRQQLSQETIFGKNIEAVAGDEAISVASDAGELETIVVSRAIAGETYRFSAAGFFQINHELLEPIIEAAIGDAAGDLAVDLYCGVGLFTLPLARRFKKVVGIESNRKATDFARENLKLANLTNGRLETARVGDWLRENSASLGKVDFLLLDPPRTGAENKDIQGILAVRPSQISYVSCDPATLARDLKKLLAAGYKLHSIKAFDMFPQTHHVETVVRLIGKQ
ncbi:MAG TPA: class I SAM-dependent RNA methyltransferase [Pyrinomonadaceae bacterium]|nr:class I SAM-dependent RNA methyltransferase [Pyrinomonadaceae bacterium]